jgi:hypothetical protein
MTHTRTSSSFAIRIAAALLAAAAIGLATPSPASAQSGGAGLRAGVSGGPDQFYFGGHFDTGFLVERLSFRPNIEIGLGEDRTTVAANFEFVYWFPLRRQPWSIYTGGGPALNVYDRDDDTDTEPGFNLLVGIAHERGLFAEFKLGLIDSPEIKFGIGVSF